MITHVVVFWTDKPLNEFQSKLQEGTRLLANIPGVLEFRHGVPVPSPRGAVDDSFSVAISMTFADQATADVYQAHPIHQQFINEYVKPLVKRLVVFDFAPSR
ncbi:MAG: Dabb family protein [Candidatus Methylacidiphilales bacterium]|nr:Dabb family protein [Candidatus Methylacidiphilales bacterium]